MICVCFDESVSCLGLIVCVVIGMGGGVVVVLLLFYVGVVIFFIVLGFVLG